MAGYHHGQPGLGSAGLGLPRQSMLESGLGFPPLLAMGLQKQGEVHLSAKAAASPLGNQSTALQGHGPLCLAQLLCPFSAPCTDFQPDRLLSLRYEQ